VGKRKISFEENDIHGDEHKKRNTRRLAEMGPSFELKAE